MEEISTAFHNITPHWWIPWGAIPFTVALLVIWAFFNQIIKGAIATGVILILYLGLLILLGV